MLAPTLPVNEAERLADVRALHILDTPREERFDRIIALARTIFRAPIAYISLVDSDRQWLKARCGLDADQTDREISFCAHTILQDDPLIIPDAVADPRFQNNPMVTGEPYIRFYAGHPVKGPSGANVGTLCIADREPRDPDALPLDALPGLAQLVEHEFAMVDVIHAQRELLDTKSRLLSAQDRLRKELEDAAAYVKSLLPRPLREGPVRADWIFEASSELGGDIFGYHNLQDGRLAVYIIDVMGHGVGAALLASAAQTALARQALPGVRFDDPGDVMRGLARTFPMEHNGGRFFTAWYGVIDPASGEVHYAAAGHPPAIIMNGDARERRLDVTGPPVGVDPDAPAACAKATLAPGSALYLFSDGAYEVPASGGDEGDGQLLMLDGLTEVIRANAAAETSRVCAIRSDLKDRAGGAFEDDVSLIELMVG